MPASTASPSGAAIRLVMLASVLSTSACASGEKQAERASECVGGTWTALEPMNERREYPNPITLGDGRLLAVNGHFTEKGALSSAELFDPATKRWSWTGSLHNPRQGGGGTRLHDGRVLVGDAFGEPDHFPSETYDPATGQWTLAAKMNDDRQNYTMTLLEGGSVLVTGGINWHTEETLASAEIYEPASGVWRVAAPLDGPRFGHRAVLVSGGRVLVIGGAPYRQTYERLATCLLYDPTTETWAATATMQHTHQVTGLITLTDGTVLVLGRGSGGDGDATAEIYTPATGEWRAATPAPRPRQQHPLVRLDDGTILAPGGTRGRDDLELTESDLYDPATDRWLEVEPATIARRNHDAVLLPDGSVVVMGGSSSYGDRYLDSVELFTPCGR